MAVHDIRRASPALRTAARVVLVLYLGWLLAATLFPIPLDHSSSGAGLSGSLNRPNATPFSGIRDTLAAPGVWPRVRLLAGNVLVFVPFGVLLPLAVPQVAVTRRVLLAGLLLSGGIELAQLVVSLLLGTWYRMSDVDDVLLNVIGVMVGWAGLKWFLLRRHRGGRRPA